MPAGDSDSEKSERLQSMSIHVQRIQFYRVPMKTRFPFRYGIASMTELPHLFVVADVQIDGKLVTGISADGLPPKWFTKNPDTTFEDDDLPAMLRVIRHAADAAVDVSRRKTFFEWWQDLYEAQCSWACNTGTPSLLAGFGFSLVERAVIDAFCRAESLTLFEALRTNRLEIDPGELRGDLHGLVPADILQPKPLPQVTVRHTIGLGDPLCDDDIADNERLSDGLPHSLVANIRTYGLSYFKIKLCGQLEVDRDRLLRIVAILNAEVAGDVRFTLDGNENFRTMAEFREHWESHRGHPVIRQLFDRALLFVEQPIHRDFALADDVQMELQSWPAAPPIIIDESDSDLSCLPRALQLGYVGTSHKNCKGVLKGLAQLATISQCRPKGVDGLLSAEDLANVGPVALLQDLAVVAALGIEHVERNGHHYFAGLSAMPESEQQRTLRNHSDLFASSGSGFPTLSVRHGLIQLGSVNSSPFGVRELPDMSAFEAWTF